MGRTIARKIFGSLVAMALGFVGNPQVEAATLYSVQDLGTSFDDSGFRQFESANLWGSRLLRINDSGSISVQPSGSPFEGSLPYSRPTPAGTGTVVFAPGVSDNGQYAAGTVYQMPTPESNWVAFLAHDGQATALGTLPGQNFSAAFGVNDSGQVVGVSGSLAFLDTPGQGMTSLGSFGGNSTAFGISNSGEIVGLSMLANGSFRAFVANGGGIVDLNTLIPPGSGLTLTSATGVNDLGQIVGYGVDGSGTYHEFLLNPPGISQPDPPPTPQPTPEPASFVLFGFGLVALAGRRRIGRWIVDGPGHCGPSFDPLKVGPRRSEVRPRTRTLSARLGLVSNLDPSLMLVSTRSHARPLTRRMPHSPPRAAMATRK